MNGDPTGNMPRGWPRDPGLAEKMTIATRFGEMEFGWDKAIYMPVGLLGFSDRQSFGLAHLPDISAGEFMLLQCLTDPDLSFIIAHYNPQSAVIERQDLDNAIASLAIPKEDAEVLVLVTLRPNKQGGGISISVNLQAPVILDTRRQTGWQFVLPKPYPLQRQL